MHVTHLDDQIIATRGVLGPAISPRRSGETSSLRVTRLARHLSNGINQQTPRGQALIGMCGSNRG